MQHFSIPCCYFPSTVVFVDNSCDFLLNFVLQLDESLAYRVFDSSVDALECIHNKRCDLNLLNTRCISEYLEAKNGALTNQSLNPDLAAIHSEVYNPQRFSDISVVVADYTMPEMDGLEFCKCIENAHIKKILLIEEADEPLALQAVNDGWIHRYIKKNEPDVSVLIMRGIHELQLQYFQSMSDMILQILSVPSPHCLQDKKFTALFRELCKKKKIVEFYLADISGSFFMLDEDARISFLMVKNDRDMRLQDDLSLNNGASEEISDHLLNEEKNSTFWQVGARSSISDELYYYAYVKGAVLFDVHQDKILSYHEHLEALDVEEMLLN